MRHPGRVILLLLSVLAVAAIALAQEDVNQPRMLGNTEARRFVPDRVPLETEIVAVDYSRISAVEFADKTRLAIAPLLISSGSFEFKRKYQFVLVTEARLRLGKSSLPSGLVAIGLEPVETDAAVMNLLTRDFSGSEIDRLFLHLGENGPSARVAIVPKGEKTFELWIGRFMTEGTKR